MSFHIKRLNEKGFKTWLSLLGYRRKDLAGGGCTFKGEGTKYDYLLQTDKYSLLKSTL